jgi:hypothetical protein
LSETLGEAADRRCAFAEEALRDASVAAVFGREGRTGRDRHVAPDDAIAAKEVRVLVEQVHRAAEPLHEAGLLAIQLREDGPRRDTLGVGVAMLAIGRDHVVLGLERGDRADAYSFLADDEVQEAADLALRVRLGGGLLHAPDCEHLAVERTQLLDRRLRVRRILGLDPLGIGSGHLRGHHAADHTHRDTRFNRSPKESLPGTEPPSDITG